MNALRLSKPTVIEVTCTDCPGAASSAIARSIRACKRYVRQWLRRDFGNKLPSDVFREHSLACYVTDKTSLKLRHEIGIDIIAWECDYPHSDCFWPDAPEQVLAELNAAGADDSDIAPLRRKAARQGIADPQLRLKLTNQSAFADTMPRWR